MKFLIITPTMNESIMDKCFESIHPKYHDNLLLIDNSKEGFAHKYQVKYKHHPENIGIARAWNIGAKKVVKDSLDYLIIMSATMVFKDGMVGLVKALEENQNPYGLETQHSWHLICLGRPTFEKVGLFDENYHPAYWEDTDMIRRLEIADIHYPISGKRLPRVDVEAESQGEALAVKSGLKVNFEALKAYFIKKWGEDNDFEHQSVRDKMYKTPFNNPKYSIKDWDKNSIETLRKKYEL